MNIDFKKFLALTSLMSAPLVAASSGCIITSDGGDSGGTTNDTASGDTGTASASASGTGDTGGDGDGDADATGGTEATDGGSATEGDTEETEGGTEGDSTGDEEIDVGNCCTDNTPTPGCSNEDIEACVCAVDEFCCDVESGWDEICVDLVQTECGIVCPE